jgi:hypothetical protein
VSGYLFVNLIAVAIAVVVALRLGSRRRFVRIFKVALLAPLLSFPWLFYGITRESWAHGDPGPILMGVPLNELILAFLMTFVTAGVLLIRMPGIVHEARRGTESKDSSPDQEDHDPG